MKATYDTYYETEHLFGNPYPELLSFFKEYLELGKVLDLGCGQGRDAIAIARLGFEVVGIDNSKVGIEQMNQIAKQEKLALTGIVANIFEYSDFKEYDIILLDSMFHFSKNDKKKETEFIKTILSKMKDECVLIFCIQDTGKKVQVLNETIDSETKLNRMIDKKFEYIFEDKETGHKSKSGYRMVIVKK